MLLPWAAARFGYFYQHKDSCIKVKHERRVLIWQGYLKSGQCLEEAAVLSYIAFKFEGRRLTAALMRGVSHLSIKIFQIFSEPFLRVSNALHEQRYEEEKSGHRQDRTDDLGVKLGDCQARILAPRSNQLS